MKTSFFCFILFLICSLHHANGQTFTGYATAGMNMNQIQGDDLWGFNRIGAYAGVGVLSDLSDRWRWSFEIAFSQHGSRASGREIENGNSVYDKIAINYVGVPIKLHYMDWLSEDETYYRLEFMAGTEYLRFINGSAVGIDGSDIDEFRPFKENVFNAVGGIYYAWSIDWAAGFVYGAGISDAQQNPAEQRQFLRQLSLRIRKTF